MNGSDLIGNSTIKCQDDGSWTKYPKCLKRCDSPIIPNSVLNITHVITYASSEVLNVTCNDIAKLHGNASITCENGTWSHLPTCQVYRCHKPSVPSHASVEDVTEYLINSTYNVTCDKGYDGNITAECKRDGDWNITGVCELQTCPNPIEIPNSKDVYNTSINFSWNDTFTYRSAYFANKKESFIVIDKNCCLLGLCFSERHLSERCNLIFRGLIYALI